jgi:type IV secretion system protein VirB10
MTTTNSAAQVNAAEQVDPKVDRDIPQLKTRKKTNNITRLVIAGLLLLMVVVLSVGVAMFMDRLKTRKMEQNAEKEKQRPTAVSEPAASLNFESMKKRIKAAEATSHPAPTTQLPTPSGAMGAAAGSGANFASAKTGAAGGSPGQTGAGYGGAGGAGAAGTYGQVGAPSQAAPLTPRQRRLSGDVLVPLGGDGQVVAAAAGAAPSPLLPVPRQEPVKTALEEQLKPSQLPAVGASRHRSMDLMLLAGESIPCGQRTFIVSTNAGQTSCIVSKNVYSANGTTLLIERGSQVLGERLGELRLGQEFMPVLWNRIVTTTGVVIDINSLATDSLGASGLPVYIDEHWGKRFGAAIMLSLISDLGQAGVAAAGSGSNTIRLTTTAGVGQDLASKALEKTINIPPTGYSLQGSAINIFLARDAYFGSVYELVKY